MGEIVFQKYIVNLFKAESIITLVALAALIVVFMVIRRKTALNTRLLSYGALSVAAAFVLSYVKLLQLPNGGTITIASMLPLFIYAYIAGPTAGMTVGLCYGLLQFIQEPFFVHPVQFLLDYPMAFAMLGLAGLFRRNIFLGSLLGSLGRFICHFLSGVVFFASYAGNQNVFVYSALYNMSYLLPETIICMGILLIPNLRSAILRVKTEAR